MVQKGKFTKTEIFCVVLTVAFLALAAGVFLRSESTNAGGQKISTWKDADTDAALPEKVNINTADEEALQTLPGIGPVLARRIIEWREANGDYILAEDLLAVEGIGLTKLNDIRDFITIQEEP